MKEIVKMIHQLEQELNNNRDEVKRLANEATLDTFKIIEHCTKMNVIMAAVLILDKVNDEAQDNTIPTCN